MIDDKHIYQYVQTSGMRLTPVNQKIRKTFKNVSTVTYRNGQYRNTCQHHLYHRTAGYLVSLFLWMIDINIIYQYMQTSDMSLTSDNQ